jgi:ABC-2 type transport system ATP-binding protein
MQNTVINCAQVMKSFRHYRHRTTSLRESFINVGDRQPIHERTEEPTIRDFNMNVSQGESVAIIGRNGSGKSTALRLIAGIYAPTNGVIETWGQLTSVIELGAGFNVELTGTENIALYGAVMGLSRSEIAERLPQIVAFADIGSHIDEAVKFYSSGMQARLAFSVAVCAEPRILLVDEVLAVGDEAFRAKCLDRIRLFLQQGGTLVVVSHDLEMIQSLCPRGIWLDDGRIRMDGAIADVVLAYMADVT